MNGKIFTKEEIQVIAKSAIGKTFAEIAEQSLITIDSRDFNKGSYGQIIEQALFGIEKNSDSSPDFLEAGIELKVTPYRKLKNNKLSAKERLVLNIINYETEYKNTFETSQFWRKNNTLQLLWYLWEENKKKTDFLITHEILIKLAFSEDLEQIKRDWLYIIDKIKAGKAHEISEGDTMYLGACTKGATAKSLRRQPFSTELAKQRAFSFKNSYMTQLVRQHIGDFTNVEKLIENKNISFIENIKNILNKYVGYTRTDLIEMFNLDTTAKNINGLIVRKMFGVKGLLGETEEFLKAKIVPKTIRIEENGHIVESIPLPAFKYEEITKQVWEDSDLYDDLETTKYMFLIFKKKNDDYIFKGFKLWNMPGNDIEKYAKDTWLKTKEIIQLGTIVKEIKNNKRYTNFPGVSFNQVMHVRPHARDSKDTFPLPVKDQLTKSDNYTKHSFWFNNNYISEFLTEFI